MTLARILLVDDQEEILREEERILSRLPGVEILTATSAAQALKLIAQERPDLVFLDLILPDLTGEQVLRVIKGKPELQSITVVIVTAKGGEEDHQRAFQLGADAYVTKPFQEEEILNKVCVMLMERGIFLEEDKP
jgi:DNA-binding response OmpR family regulator